MRELKRNGGPMMGKAFLARSCSGTVAAAFVMALIVAVPTRPTAAQGGGETGGLPEVNGWSLAASLLEPVSEQAVAALDGKVYIVGGYPGDRIPVAKVRVYDPATNNWQPGPPLP